MRFLVFAGNKDANILLEWRMASEGGAVIDPSFFAQGNCTVAYRPDGSWIVARGAPPSPTP
jgi:hypothetical protein